MQRTLLLALVIATLIGSSARVGAQETLQDAKDQRDAIQQAYAENAAALDLVTAEDAEIVDALDRIEAWIAVQEAGLDANEQARAAAAQTERAVRAEADELQARITELQRIVAAQSVETYMGGFGGDLVLTTDDLNSVPLLKFLLEETTGRSNDSADVLRRLLGRQHDLIAQAENVSAQAAALGAQITARLDELDASRADAERIRLEIAKRKADLEAKADELVAADQEITSIIRSAEAEAIRQAAAAADQAAREAEARRLAEAATPSPAPTAVPTPTPAAVAEPTPGGDATPTPQASQPPADPEPTPTATPTAAPDGAPAFTWPVPGRTVSPFGNRVHPVYGTVKFHSGIDIDANSGAPIGAAASGVVLYGGWVSGYGNTVVVDHGNGFSTLYAHMSEFNTNAGAVIATGDVLGFVGMTGVATGPHLHFEIRINGAAVDPLPYLP